MISWPTMSTMMYRYRKYGICWGYSTTDNRIPNPSKEKNLLALNKGILEYNPSIMNILPREVVTRHSTIAKPSTIILFNFYLCYCFYIYLFAIVLLLIDRSFYFIDVWLYRGWALLYTFTSNIISISITITTFYDIFLYPNSITYWGLIISSPNKNKLTITHIRKWLILGRKSNICKHARTAHTTLIYQLYDIRLSAYIKIGSVYTITWVIRGPHVFIYTFLFLLMKYSMHMYRV